MTSSDDQDRSDMSRLKAGHDAALNDLMARHGERLFHFLIRALQNEDDAADLAQETFVRVFQSRARFDSKNKFTTWLYAIASNLVRDRYRYRTRHPQVSLEAENAQTGGTLAEQLVDERVLPAEKLQSEERIDAIRRAIGALPEDVRLPLILSEYEGMKQADIGEILHCTTKAVETRIYRARQQLRTVLAAVLER